RRARRPEQPRDDALPLLRASRREQGERMKIAQETLSVATRGRGLYDVTRELRAAVSKSGITTGLCTVFLQHTSASLVIQENADPAVLRDLERWMERLAPEDVNAYEHDDEGPDDM